MAQGRPRAEEAGVYAVSRYAMIGGCIWRCPSHRPSLSLNQEVKRYRYPSRFEPDGGRLFRMLTKVDEVACRLGLLLAVVLIERIVFGPAFGRIIRWVLRRIVRQHITAIEPAFESIFYLRQFAGASRRRCARDPLLHYALIGWRQERSPAAAFDPLYFRRSNPTLPKSIDPLLLHVNDGGYNTPCHELSKQQALHGWLPDKDTIFTVHHGRGGGSSTFLDLYEQNARAEGHNVLRLRAVAGGPTLGVVDEPRCSACADAAPQVVFDLALDLMELAKYCRRRRVVRLVINHVIDRPREMLDWIKSLSSLLDCPYDVVLHDYYALCPRVNMVTGSSEFCDAAPVEVCAGCIGRYGSDVSEVEPYAWRRDFLAFLNHADRIIVPSGDLAARMRSRLPSKSIVIWQPESDDGLPSERTPLLRADEPLRVLAIGALSVPKGVRVLRALAGQAASAGDLMTFMLIGEGAEAKRLQQAGVRVTGFYRSADLDDLIEEAKPHIVFLPSIWPETWSFVLTSALRRALPVVAFDIGAPAERLRRLRRGYLLPLELSTRPADLLAAFRTLREQWVVL